MDDLSIQEKNGAREFFDPETASSFGSSHVPSQPMSIPSLRELISHDSCLQLDTRNSFGMSGDIFEDLLAPSEPSAAFFGNLRITLRVRKLSLNCLWAEM